MSLRNIHLRKLLKAFGLSEKEQISFLRGDIRQQIKIDNGFKGGGGDFHKPFWSDVKSFVYSGADLKELTNDRMNTIANTKRLYPMLYKGFMDWWNNKKRFNNEEINPHPITLNERVQIQELNTTVKIENFIGVSIGTDEKRLIYPYFAENPVLSDENARIGLWLISQAFADFHIEDFRILDVLRGEPFSVEKYRLEGTEEHSFNYKLQRMIDLREKLKLEY